MVPLWCLEDELVDEVLLASLGFVLRLFVGVVRRGVFLSLLVPYLDLLDRMLLLPSSLFSRRSKPTYLSKDRTAHKG